MSVRTLKSEKGTSYFFTITNCKWISLFEYTNFYSKIYDWFNFLAKRGDRILGYCIMPNHLHGMVYLQKDSPVINEVIGEAKMLMSYAIAARLKRLNATQVLAQLQNAVSEYEKKKGLKHKVFEDSFDCKECFTYEFIQQKLQYMHYNPVKAGLVNIPELYEHSSAKFYITGEQGIYPVTHYAELYERGNN
ncbi:hypothetical protein I5907_01990 [Panacibacter sp. DH6]|uniref:Transposase IS200-like domain-containing protein n=1 Tax=Panacibacter microcysteis TaxID=2793269 RepID=A0A931GSZ7_9BACT|nr:hypothetical protein [Panacibacter microcysteis]MBG9374981.1 hypothetical protein [Panacibacter microcysteis]